MLVLNVWEEKESGEGARHEVDVLQCGTVPTDSLWRPLYPKWAVTSPSVTPLPLWTVTVCDSTTCFGSRSKVDVQLELVWLNKDLIVSERHSPRELFAIGNRHVSKQLIMDPADRLPTDRVRYKHGASVHMQTYHGQQEQATGDHRYRGLVGLPGQVPRTWPRMNIS